MVRRRRCRADRRRRLLIGLVGLARRIAAVRPWLAEIVGINAGAVDHAALRAVDPIDILLLVCAALAYAALWPGPGGSWVPWMVLAIAFPLAGIPVLLATHLSGRTSLMAGGLVLSVLMIVGGAWTGAGWLGVFANGVLFIGDLVTTGRRSRPVAIAAAVGYLALVAWFLWIAVRLLVIQH